MNEILERRLEYLRLEAKGFSLCDAVKYLSEKYHVSERTIYNDAETRGTWQPVLTQIFDLDKALLMVFNRYDFLYQLASIHFQTASESQKPVYLSKMVEITDKIVGMLGLGTLKQRQEAKKNVAALESELAKTEDLMHTLAKVSK